MRTIAALFFVCVCWSQQPEFEVASVKPNNSGSQNSNFNRMAGGGLNAINVTLKEMILWAYDIREYQLAGGPSWLDKDRYDVVAKPDKNDNPTGAKRSFQQDIDPLRMKLRALLASRFQLAVHKETRELPIYALVIGRNGPHLTETKNENLTINNRKGLVICKKVTMKDFAAYTLTNKVGRTVVDKTGLTGEYDFEIKYMEDQGAASSDASGPDFLTAMQEQIGLRLESQRGPVEMVVIDRVEKASAN